MSQITRNGKLIARLLREVADKFDSGECNLSSAEMISLGRMVSHERWYLSDLERYYHCTQRTIERWSHDGLIPPLQKDETNHKYIWHDEIWAWEMERGSPVSDK